MRYTLSKQAAKYLLHCDQTTRDKLRRALKSLTSWDGNIVKLRGYDNSYRLKIEHYRVLFSLQDDGTARVTEINTRTNIKY
ncbi:hypothetical protein AGMMS49992_22640 [Clostridia bacterium]|nr:hypothetical protein AGMMS49992_22640 [Clostridia bacterium]